MRGFSSNLTLPRLHSLVLSRSSQSPQPEHSFLDTLTLPALLRLQVTENLLVFDPVGVLTSLVERSGCKLQQLCVPTRFFPRDWFQTMLPSIASIVQTDYLDVDEGAFFEDGGENGETDTDGAPDEYDDSEDE